MLGAAKKIVSFHREMRTTPFYKIITVVNRTCSEDAGLAVTGKLRSVEESNLNLEKPSEMFESFALKRCGNQNECDYAYSGVLKGCVPNSESLTVINHLNEVGFKKFILLGKRNKPLFELKV